MTRWRVVIAMDGEGRQAEIVAGAVAVHVLRDGTLHVVREDGAQSYPPESWCTVRVLNAAPGPAPPPDRRA